MNLLLPDCLVTLHTLVFQQTYRKTLSIGVWKNDLGLVHITVKKVSYLQTDGVIQWIKLCVGTSMKPNRVLLRH